MTDTSWSGARLRWAAAVLTSMLLCPVGVATAQDVPQTLRQRALQSLLGPLGGVPLLDPGPIYLSDRQALQRLGKALFWDQQLGSDGQACASCHFHAGADNRSKNQLNPGFRNEIIPGGDKAFDGKKFGPNYQLTLADFPIQTNDVVSSQGVFAAKFTGIGFPGDSGTADPTDPTNAMASTAAVFDVGGAVVRSVPPRNTPSAVNAVYNRRNFWDSRARDEFNGADPIGDLDPTARVVMATHDAQGNLLCGQAGSPDSAPACSCASPSDAECFANLSVPGLSAASQAVGPPLSNLEMSYDGRQYTDLGRKMFSSQLQPLGQQLVATDDSLLGAYSAQRIGAGVKGVTFNYADLVKQAFPRQWWDVPGCVDVSGPQPIINRSGVPGPKCFTAMEYNFSFFFGLAVNEYEKTLRAVETRFDSFLMGDDNALNLQERDGLELFIGRGRCKECHSGQMLSNASIAAQDTTPLQLDNLLPPHNIERMVVGSPCSPEEQVTGTCPDVPANDPVVKVYDAGFYNIGVRPTLEDKGIGTNIGPNAQIQFPLSFSQRLVDCVTAAVPAILAAQPTLTQDQAVRLANTQAPPAGCAVPHIAARPIEAATVLARAWLVASKNGLPVVDGLTISDFIKAAQDLLTGQPPAATSFALAASPIPIDSAGFPDPLGETGFLFQAQALLASDMPFLAATVQGRVQKLLDSATSLLPDPVTPGPDPLNYFAPPMRPNELTNVLGAFKTPGLRNVELTAPYFHNGGQGTLNQVVQFYDRGGDFHSQNIDNLDPNIAPIGLLDFEEEDLVAFLKSLTDERAKYEREPFDHPSLSLPNGGTPGHSFLFGAVPFLDDRFELPAIGRTGSPIPLGTPGTPFANFPDAMWSRIAVDSGGDQSAEPGTALGKSLVVRITDAYGSPVAGFPVAFSAPAGGSVNPDHATTGPDGTATTVATLAPGAGDQTFSASAFTVLDSPMQIVAHAVSSSSPSPPSGTPSSGGGCSSAPGDAASALLIAAAALARRRRSPQGRRA
jgi:cytochrome c peroxidase